MSGGDLLYISTSDLTIECHPFFYEYFYTYNTFILYILYIYDECQRYCEVDPASFSIHCHGDLLLD